MIVIICGGSSSSNIATQQVSSDLEHLGAFGINLKHLEHLVNFGEFLSFLSEFLPWWVLSHYFLCGGTLLSAWSDLH